MRLLIFTLMLFSLLVLATPPSHGAEGGLTTEDVVREFATGAPVAELIDRIMISEVDFDLSDEVVAELRSAGLPEELLKAMSLRQAQQETAREGVPGPAMLWVSFNADWQPATKDPPPPLRVNDRLTQAMAEHFGLENPSKKNRITDLALYLVCRTPGHAQEDWRELSPLGEDRITMPAHRLLWFHGGAKRVRLANYSDNRYLEKDRRSVPDRDDRVAKGWCLELEIPATVEIPLLPGVEHDLSLGLALKIDGRYYRWMDDTRDDIVLGPHDDLVLEAKVTSGHDLEALTLRVRFEEESE